MNPLSALMEIADTTSEKKTTELVVQHFFQRFGFFSDEKQIAVPHDEIIQIAYHYKLLLTILQEYYKIGKNYSDLFCKCVEYYLLHSQTIVSYKDKILLAPEDDYFHMLFKSFDDIRFDGVMMEKVNQAKEIKEKCDYTTKFVRNSLRQTLLFTHISSNYANTIEEALNDDSKAKPPEILLLMNSVSEKSPYYLNDHKVCFENEVNKNKCVASYKKYIDSVAASVIQHAISNMALKYIFSIEECACCRDIESLKHLIDYSLMLLYHRDYGYFPCCNPNCRRYVLRKRPNYDIIENRYCSSLCSRAQNQRNYKLRQKK